MQFQGQSTYDVPNNVEKSSQIAIKSQEPSSMEMRQKYPSQVPWNAEQSSEIARKVYQCCQILSERAQHKMAQLKRGKSANWKNNMQSSVRGKKLKVQYNLEIYHGWNQKGYSGKLQAWYGNQYICQTIEKADKIQNPFKKFMNSLTS